MRRNKITSRRTQTRETNGQIRLPASFLQVIEVRRERDCVGSPGREPEKRTNSNPPKAGRIGAFRASEPPIKITLWPGGVHIGINSAIVSFLVHHQTLRAGRD